MSDKLAAHFGFARLVVRNLQREAAFYRAVMGYGEGQTIRASINGRPLEEIIFINDGKAELILLAYDDGPAPSPTGVMLGFITQDLEAFEKRVVAAGGAVFQPIGPMEGGNEGTRLGIYADPESFLFEVIQW